MASLSRHESDFPWIGVVIPKRYYAPGWAVGLIAWRANREYPRNTATAKIMIG